MKRLLLCMSFCFVAASASAEMPLIELKAGKQTLTAEVASTDPDRMQGLMHRRMLPRTAACCSCSRMSPTTACG